MDGFIDAYTVLGVPSNASQDELKAAHRRLVRRHHPDLAPPERRAEATRRMQEVNVAYGLLRDPPARARYDRLRRLALGRQAAATATSGGARRVARADAQLAAQWDAVLQAAGRWAGRWWRRNRRAVRHAAVTAALRARRAGLDVVGRVLWLGSCAAWALLGLALGVATQRLTGASGPLTPLTGVAAGALVGSQRGWHRRLRLAGYRPGVIAARAGLASAAGALAVALLIDARF